jgi:hypothetical protein
MRQKEKINHLEAKDKDTVFAHSNITMFGAQVFGLEFVLEKEYLRLSNDVQI